MGKHRIAFPVVASVLLFGASGCLVQSLDPFYTEANRVAVPGELLGEWRLVEDALTGVSSVGSDALKDRKPWVLEADHAIAYDWENVPARLDPVFFRVKDRLYCDVFATFPEPGEKPNVYWTLTVVPAHTLFRVFSGKDRLIFAALDPNRLVQEIRAGRVKLPMVESSLHRSVLFAASPGEWEAFLRDYDDRPDAFPGASVFVWQRPSSPAFSEPATAEAAGRPAEGSE
ncbi:MAG: hypothetical protein V1918_07205 [Planctomycetota bacterium]